MGGFHWRMESPHFPESGESWWSYVDGLRAGAGLAIFVTHAPLAQLAEQLTLNQ